MKIITGLFTLVALGIHTSAMAFNADISAINQNFHQHGEDDRLRAATQEEVFPYSWIGQWGGQCAIGSFEFPMKLVVETTDQDNTFQWQITYFLGQNPQVRDYTISPGEQNPNHFIIDEKNSIVINNYFMEDTFSETLMSLFKVQTNIIPGQYRRMDDQMFVTLPLFSDLSPSVSGGGVVNGFNVPKVLDWGASSLQNCILYRG